ncbi:MAG TPA: hypothetical protein VHA33_16700 [Candidatus Angelobacter sp.]|jgi:hypothetical protein|nr:hypothetical protein [Candidatus Angelobacter sp.]
MAAQKGPNIFLCVGLFLIGTILIFYVFRSNGWHPGVSPSAIWGDLPTSTRAVAVGGFIASAYGLGGILNHFLSKKLN